MGKSVLIYVMGAFIILSVALLNANRNVDVAGTKSVRYMRDVKSRNICNSITSVLLSRIADSTSLRILTPETASFMGESASYTVQEVSAGSDTLQVIVSANVADSVKTLTTYISIGSPTPAVAKGIQGAVSAGNAVSTGGNMQVDGRDHDINGVLVPGGGTYGIWTTSTLSQGGSSDIGGTSTGTDYAPSKPANASVIKTAATYPDGSFPTTPDEVFGGVSSGFPEGTLKNLAISGADGGQYVTNPSSLSTPFSGITYVELPSGDRWQSMNITGTGILIVHNSDRNAIFKNLNSGTFKGIIIADDIIHIHTNIIGAVIGLSNSPSEGNFLGNGSGSVKYSKEAIDAATRKVNKGASTSNYGFGKMRLNILGWYE